MSAPLSPSLKDLPKVAFDLKSELEGFNTDNMKKADTNEKIVLPTAEGINKYFKISTFICLIVFMHLFFNFVYKLYARGVHILNNLNIIIFSNHIFFSHVNSSILIHSLDKQISYLLYCSK